MFTSIKDFTSTWAMETASTLACLEKLTDESLSKELVSDYRTIGRLANHIVDTAISIPHEGGLPVAYEKKVCTTKQELIDTYKDNAQKVEAALSSWSDADLAQEIPMYGETWKKGFVLTVTILHQTHHRGQLTVLMRQAGLKVPGVYGPCKEEWEAMGLPEAD